MPKESAIQHHVIDNPASLSYFTNSSPISGPQWADGANLMGTVAGYIEPRPGFAEALESAVTTFINLKRIFVWQKWTDGTSDSSGAYVAMFCDVVSGQAKVYKYVIGYDTSAVLLWTSTSAEPFDFVTSNNTCFFGNGTDMKKFLAASLGDVQVYKWGIATPTVPSVATVSGASSSTRTPTAAAGTNWTNPTYALTDDSNYAVYNTTTQDLLKLTAPNFSLPAVVTVNGFQVSVKGNGASGTSANRQVQVGLTKDGSTLYGAYKTITLKQTTDSTTVVGSTTDLFGGASWLKADVEAATFGVLVRDADTTAASLNLNFVQVTVFYATTSGSGTLNATTGYQYCYTYGNSGTVTGHESSPSQLSSCTGTFSNRSVDIAVIASGDTQVDQIHVYRTTDGGSGDPELMQEITGSPFANSTSTVNDNTDDGDLGLQTAPAFFRNDPPIPTKGFVYSQARIWGFAGNKTRFSGQEEIRNGVPEEAWPGGLDGNYEPWDKQVTGHAKMDDGIAVFTAGTIYKIEGDSLDTFRRYKLMDKRGAKNRACITSLGSSVAWLDTSSQVWVSDLGEVGQGIRPTLAHINHDQAAIVIHISGRFHHLVLMDGENGILYVLDLDTRKWQVPWVIGDSASAIFSGETATGVIDLLVARNNTKVLRQTPDIYTDYGDPYVAFGVSSLFPINKQSQPEWVGVVDYIAIERNAVDISDMAQINDDDPQLGTFFSIIGNAKDPDRRSNQTNIVKKIYMSQPESDTGKSASAQRVAFRIGWPARDQAFRLYSLDVGFHQLPE